MIAHLTDMCKASLSLMNTLFIT